MSARKKIKTVTDTVSLIGASFIIFLLFTSVISRYEPAWLDFWLLSIFIVIVCAALSRIVGWFHDYFFG